MKKILIIMALVLVISGCSSKTPITSKVDNGSGVVATVNGINVTKQVYLYNFACKFWG